MSDTDEDICRLSHTLPTLQSLHDRAVLEFERPASMRPDDMIIVHLLDGMELKLSVESVESDGVITVAVHTRIGFVHVQLIAEAGSKGRRWKVDYGPGRENLDLT